MCRTEEDTRHPHQRRIPENVLREAHQRLKKCRLDGCASFEELHDVVQQAIGDIRGIGPLTVYDIALRFGAFLNLEPQVVYLHRGTRRGAVALGFVRKQKTLERKDLPSEFLCLRSREIEDCLCIYEDELRRIAKT